MNKLAQYLNQHLLGEVVTDSAVLEKLSIDGSPFTFTPEIAVYPRNTSDIRKLARFTWKLSEKGHILPLIARGAGTNLTGGAIGEGVTISLTAHMNRVYEYDAKQQLIRLQPGASLESVRNTLVPYNAGLPIFMERSHATIGGVIADARNTLEPDSWVDQLEVVLANGDVMQTARLSKKELNRKKGEQSFEADIYRSIDKLIEENQELIDSLSDTDVSGYSAIRHVKKKDGSIDLSPLFFASQGTLGIISELILKTEWVSPNESVIVGTFDDRESARDLLDKLAKFDVSKIEYYDGALVQSVSKNGKEFTFLPSMANAAAVVIVRLNDASDRARNKKIKRLSSLFSQVNADIANGVIDDENEIAVINGLASLASHNSDQGVALPILHGLYVPLEQFERFYDELQHLARKRGIELSMWGRPLEGIWYISPSIKLKSVTGKQLAIKLIADLAMLTAKCGGNLVGESAEGRLHAYSAHSTMEDEVKDLYVAIKAIFDPKGILNPGVKESPVLSKLVKRLRSDYVSGFSDGLVR